MIGVPIKGKTGPKALKGVAGMDQCKMNNDQRKDRSNLREGSDKDSSSGFFCLFVFVFVFNFSMESLLRGSYAQK